MTELQTVVLDSGERVVLEKTELQILLAGGGGAGNVDLTTQVIGVLPIANGGTGAASFAAAGLLVSGGALGTPASGVATNLTGLPIATGLSGLTINGILHATSSTVVASTASFTWNGQTVGVVGGTSDTNLGFQFTNSDGYSAFFRKASGLNNETQIGNDNQRLVFYAQGQRRFILDSNRLHIHGTTGGENSLGIFIDNDVDGANIFIKKADGAINTAQIGSSNASFELWAGPVAHKAKLWVTAGRGFEIVADTATTDVNALSITQTANNAAVVDFLKFTWTVTSAAAAASYLRILAGTAGTSPVLVGRKTGDLEIGSSAVTAAQGYSRVAIKHATTTLASVSGAAVTATNLIPAKANVLGVNTIVTVSLGTGSGTTGYAVGDGVDANRWGDVVGTAAGTDTDGNDATADPTGWFNAANNVVITAAGGNFDGTGSIFVDVSYTLTEAD